MQPETTLIVGAGPTGLAMAIELKRAGIPLRLIDKSEHAAQWSQALVVQARTLEQFERYGIAEKAASQGTKLPKASLISDGRKVLSFSLERIPGRYKYALFLPQTKTERILIGHLQSLGVEVERGTELTGLRDAAESVSAQLRHKDGSVENVTARWLIGCDGAHSTVRETLRIPFPGDNVGISFFLGDLEIQGPDVPGDVLNLVLRRGGNVLVIGRLSQKIYRVIVALHAQQGAMDMNRKLTIQDFQEAIDRTGLHIQVVSSEWMTPFHVNERKVEHYRHGNVFLAGDAAHIHSPVAGQGMNTGIQDAANLGWKIAAVASGADPKLLDSYDEERGAVGEALLKTTSRGLKGATLANPILEAIRDTVFSIASKFEPVQDYIAGFVSETAIQYRKSSIVTDCGGSGSLRAGDRMPNPDVDGPLLEPLHQGGHLGIAIDPVDRAGLRERLPGANWRFVNNSDLDPESLHQLGPGGTVLIVRPDGYIGFRGTARDQTAITEYARRTGAL